MSLSIVNVNSTYYPPVNFVEFTGRHLFMNLMSRSQVTYIPSVIFSTKLLKNYCFFTISVFTPFSTSWTIVIMELWSFTKEERKKL